MDADHEDRLYIHKDQTKKLKKRLVYSAKEPKARKERGCAPARLVPPETVMVEPAAIPGARHFLQEGQFLHPGPHLFRR